MFATTADELLSFFRAEVNDQAAQGLWENWEIYGYMTEGLDALLKRAEVKYQTLRLPYLAGASSIPLSPKVLHIRFARIVGGGTLEFMPASTAGAPRSDYGLQLTGSVFDEGSGTPVVFVRDYEAKALKLLPRPNVGGELELQCTVNIGVPMEAGTPLPTTDSEDLRLVLHYMKSLAYQKHDAETEDLVRARFHEDRFRAGVLDRESRLRNMRRPPGVVQMRGW